jgi:hypothetical protein
VPHRPEQRAKPNRLRPQQRFQIHALGAEADTRAAERTPARPIQPVDQRRNLVGRQTAERVHQLVHQPPRRPGQRQGLRREERLKAALDLVSDKSLQSLPNPLLRLALKKIAAAHLDPRC